MNSENIKLNTDIDDPSKNKTKKHDSSRSRNLEIIYKQQKCHSNSIDLKHKNMITKTIEEFIVQNKKIQSKDPENTSLSKIF